MIFFKSLFKNFYYSDSVRAFPPTSVRLAANIARSPRCWETLPALPPAIQSMLVFKQALRVFKKNKLKAKILNIFLMFLLLFNNTIPIFAQSSSSSADLNVTPADNLTPTLGPTSQPPPGPFEEPTSTPTVEPPGQTTVPTGSTSLENISPTLDPTTAPIITPNILTTPAPQLSATIRTPIKSYLISKSHLTGGQSLAVGLLNAKDVELKTSLFKDGEEVRMEIQKKVMGDVVVLIVDPPVSFTPGKYSLKITDPSGHVEEQNFLWGVLAINTDKSIYGPKEEAKLGFAVLDEEGRMVCDAKLELKVKSEKLKVDDLLSTENGKIRATSQCSQKSTSNTPDYTASYQVGEAGTYNLELTAVTKNGTYSIIDSFEAREDIPFIVDRGDFPTRLNPSENVEVGVKITASQDFTGTIVEAVPDVINIVSSSATPYKWIATGVSKTDNLITGADSPLIIRYPFEGNYAVTLKFGEEVKDSQERSLYDQFGLKGHDGVDFALPEGTPVMAVDDGEVILAGRGAYGITVVLQHTWGRSYYGHLQGTGMNLGEKVLKGDKIGLSGKTGLATGPHLHFGIKFTKNDMENGYYGKVDPWPYLTGSSIIPGFSVKLIGWDVSLKAGETKDLRYRIDAPDVSPQFYLFGPLRFFEASPEPQNISSDSPFVLGLSTAIDSKSTFSEKRQWQIAVDAPEAPSFQTEPAASQSDTRRAERSVISKGKIVDTNLKENPKALARSRGQIVAGVKDTDKLFRWEVELPSQTVFGFGRQEKADILPTVRIRNREGWYVEFEPNLIELPKVKPKVSGNQIEWEISPGIKARYTALKDRIKADYIVNDKASLEQIGNRLTFQVRYNDIVVPENLSPEELQSDSVKDAGLLSHELLPDGTIVWLMENGMPAFEHPVPKIMDSANSEFPGTYEINKNSQGLSSITISIPENELLTATFPLTIDPVIIDSVASATVTAFANARQIMRDAWGNLIVVLEGGLGNDSVYYKNYDSTSWTDAGIGLGSATDATETPSADLDSSGNLHVAYFDDAAANTPISYQSYTVNRNGSNAITGFTALTSQFNLDTSGLGRRPSLIVANKGEGSGKEKVAIAWAMNSAKGGTKRGEIRFAQCDVADRCDAASEWKNASEQRDMSGTCSDASAGVPNAIGCAGGADVLFKYTGGHTTHHAVLSQVPGRPARTPLSAKMDNDGTFSDLTDSIDDNTSTAANISNMTANDYIYIGDDNLFSRIIVDITEINTLGTGCLEQTNDIQYYNGSTWATVANPKDNTGNPPDCTGHSSAPFNGGEVNGQGSILFNQPSNWEKTTIDGVNKYWVRLQPNSTDSLTTIAEFDVTDRHSKDLLIVGGNGADAYLGTAYVIWDFIGQAGWENIPGNTTAPAPWRVNNQSISGGGALWTELTNFPLSITTDPINNMIYVSYVECGGGSCSTSSQLFVDYKSNKTNLTSGPSTSGFPAVTEATDINLSITSDQNDIYLFYILDPEAAGGAGGNLTWRRCDPRGGGTRDICDNSADWSSEQVIQQAASQTHVQAVVSRAFGDTVAIDIIWTRLSVTPRVDYERHYVNMADTTVVTQASAGDSYHIDCITGTDDQLIDVSVKVGLESADTNCDSSVYSQNHGGFKFSNINISQGAAISSAYFTFHVNTLAAGGSDLTVYGQDVADAVTSGSGFSSYTNAADSTTDLIDNLTKTTNNSGQLFINRTHFYRINVTDIIQEIVCQGAASAQPCVGDFFEDSGDEWASGNGLAILLISNEIIADSYINISDSSVASFAPTLTINLGNASKRYSMGVLGAPTTASDLDHPMETEEFTAVNTDDTQFASVSASLVPSASSSAVPIFQFKANNTNNNNTDDMSVTAIAKSSIPSKSYGGLHYSGRQICLQVYDTSSGWGAVGSCDTATVADTDITLSGTVTGATTKYETGPGGGSCSGSDCWATFRVYQDAATEANQILYVDYFNVSFSASGPTTDQLLHHGAWFNASGVEQPFTF